MDVLPVRGCHPSGPPFQTVLVLICTTTGLVRFRSPLLAESRLMSFPPGTEMFQFPGFASILWIQHTIPHSAVGCPIRKSTDQRLLAPPRGLSQRATSFIASWCQGIHQMPFITSSPPHTSDRPVEFLDGLSAFGLPEPGLHRTNADLKTTSHQEHEPIH